MKCLVFDIWGDFGQFRKFYTTSSPLTFSFPPRTAITGMLAAIAGIDKNEYLKYFTKADAHIALRIMKPVKKFRVSYNLIDTKTAKMMSKIQNRTQVTSELLKDCAYRIYFNHKDEELYNKIRDNLIAHKCYYTLCLGLSEFLANFKFTYESKLFEVMGGGANLIDSVLPFKEDQTKIEFETGKEYFKDIVPNEMNEDREVTEYLKVIYERNCKPISCRAPKIYNTSEGEKIVFL